MHAYGLAPVEPTRRTVDVDAFCSWSACRMNSRSSALAATGLISSGPLGTSNIMCRKRSTYSRRSEEHTSELQSLMRTSYDVFCLTKKNNTLAINQQNKR